MINLKREGTKGEKMVYENILNLIGNTPVVKLKNEEENIAYIYEKLKKLR